jgi:hypothetical protein
MSCSVVKGNSMLIRLSPFLHGPVTSFHSLDTFRLSPFLHGPVTFSVVDYAICSHNLYVKMEEVLIGDQIWDLKSDHKPIYLSFSWNRKEAIRV